MRRKLSVGAALAVGLALALASHATKAQSAASAAPPPVLRSAYGERLKLAGIPNGGKINDSLFRGAQPRQEGFQQLKNLGVTTVVDLRGEDPQRVAWERQQSESLGIRFVSIPLSGWNPPSNDQIALFLALFRNNPREKVYVHCRYGEDRTGVFVAAYRMALEGWQPQQALNEMYYFGFNGMWHPSMKSYVRDFPARLKTAPAFAEFRPVSPAQPATTAATSR
jgi:protein tyrosine/serine phosphatase